MTRRGFLNGIAAAAATTAAPWRAAPPQPSIPIIDAHIHLFDPTRPQGAPYSGPPGVPTTPALPDRYRKLAMPLGIVGAVKVEASPWIEDNLWVLEVAQRDPIVVGVIGNLEPEKPEFPEYLERYRKNPLFRGIRCGNLWGRNLAAQVSSPAFIRGLELLAQADLVMDTANPNVPLLDAIVRLTDKVGRLRVVIDHLPSLEPPEAAAERSAYDKLLRELAQRPQIYVKLSAIIHRVNNRVATDLKTHRPRLDALMDTFGEDRVIFGSDWPNSDGVAPIEAIVGIAKEYFATKPVAVAEKYFWRNSAAAYKWIKRHPSQPGVA